MKKETLGCYASEGFFLRSLVASGAGRKQEDRDHVQSIAR